MKVYFYFVTLSALLVCMTVNTTGLKAQYIQDDEILTAGEMVIVSVPSADTLIVTYRPGSSISETETFPVAGGRFEWLPRQAGIASLSTPGGPSQTVSVRFSTFPFAGFIVLILAGGILFGGAILASISLFGKTSPELFASRPDT